MFYLTTLVNPLNAELNPICHLLPLAGAHHFVHVIRVRIKRFLCYAVLDFDTELFCST